MSGKYGVTFGDSKRRLCVIRHGIDRAYLELEFDTLMGEWTGGHEHSWSYESAWHDTLFDVATAKRLAAEQGFKVIS